MRFLGVVLFGIFSGSVCAADPLPSELQTLPHPPVVEESPGDNDFEPRITITQKKDVVIDEYRVGGRLFKIKVIPKIGKPYYLIDSRGDGQFSRVDVLDGSNMLPPQWVIHEF